MSTTGGRELQFFGITRPASHAPAISNEVGSPPRNESTGSRVLS